MWWSSHRFFLLGDVVFGALLAPSYVEPALTLRRLLIANALLVLRAYHFGQ